MSPDRSMMPDMCTNNYVTVKKDIVNIESVLVSFLLLW